MTTFTSHHEKKKKISLLLLNTSILLYGKLKVIVGVGIVVASK
jgi:hypothetical protein